MQADIDIVMELREMKQNTQHSYKCPLMYFLRQKYDWTNKKVTNIK